MTRALLLAAGLLGAAGVALGAFGAHGLSALLAAHGRQATFDTAVQYHLIHAAALIGAAWAAERWPGRLTAAAGLLFIVGVGLFSGALYLLSLFELGFMGAVAPFGGAALVLGWLCLGIAGWRGGRP